jgi:hypothetical protein
MSLLAALFIIGAIVAFALVFFGMLGTDAMPFACPRCHAPGDDEDIAGTSRPWYALHGSTVRCRTCHTWFKEHPNGSLVEDRDD